MFQNVLAASLDCLQICTHCAAVGVGLERGVISCESMNFDLKKSLGVIGTSCGSSLIYANRCEFSIAVISAIAVLSQLDDDSMKGKGAE